MRQATWLGAMLLAGSATLGAQAARPTAEAPPGAAPGGRPATVDDVLKLKAVSSPAISPDGRTVLYTVRQWEPGERDGRTESRTRIWLTPVAGGPGRQMAYGERGDSQPQWSPDGRYISFVSSRGPQSADQPAPAQIYLMRTDGGEAVKLTDAKESVTAYAWSPDSQAIAFLTTVARTADEEGRLKKRDDERVYEGDTRYSEISVADVATMRARRVIGGEPYVVAGAPQWSPDGRRLVFAAKPTTMIRDNRTDLYLVPASGESAVPVKITTNPGPDSAPRFSPDGQWIAYLAEITDAAPLGDGIALQPVTQEHLMLYDLNAGKVVDASQTTFDIAAGTPVWSADSSRIYFTSGKGVYNEAFAYDLASSTYRPLTTGRSVSLGNASRDGQAFAVTLDSPRGPADVYVADASFKTFTRVTTANPQADALALGESDVITWKSTDGLEIEGVLLKPVGYRAGQRVPLLVVAHGGPTGAFTNGYRLGGLEGGQVLAGQGWAVLYPNVRGSTNYGERFMRANIPDWGGGDWRDLMTGVDAVIARGIADPDRLALIGWSYGGYMTAWGITQTPRFKAAMVGAGITNVWSMYGTNDIPNYLGTFFGGIPDKRTQALYLERSAMSHVDKVTTPTLILHGGSDERVPTGQALELHRALKERGKTTELVFYPREGHGIQEYEHQKDRLERIHAWLTKYTLGELRKTTMQ